MLNTAILSRNIFVLTFVKSKLFTLQLESQDLCCCCREDSQALSLKYNTVLSSAVSGNDAIFVTSQVTVISAITAK